MRSGWEIDHFVWNENRKSPSYALNRNLSLKIMTSHRPSLLHFYSKFKNNKNGFPITLIFLIYFTHKKSDRD